MFDEGSKALTDTGCCLCSFAFRFEAIETLTIIRARSVDTAGIMTTTMTIRHAFPQTLIDVSTDLLAVAPETLFAVTDVVMLQVSAC